MATKHRRDRCLLTLLVVGLFSAGDCEDSPRVDTRSGPVRGVIDSESLQPKTVFAFRNVPFAKPPVGRLRFQPPEEVEAWTEVKDALPGRNISCPQIPDFPNIAHNATAIIGQEDCLVLDIYTKQLPPKSPPLPVIVYFHGGRFTQGGKDQYGPLFLLRHNDLVLVIVNYRLGILGFLSTEDADFPGNAGLLDQRMALKWVATNIAAFGGDPSKMTIAGHDAGAVSVALHILSPFPEELFSGAISGSGTALDPWALTKNPREHAMSFGREIGCSTASSRALVDCLKKMPLQKILETQHTTSNLTFRPSVDSLAAHPFLPAYPNELYKRKDYKKIPYLAGVTKNEASIEFYSRFPEAIKEANIDKILLSVLEPYLRDTPNAESVVKAAKYQYLRGVYVPDFFAIREKGVELMTDFLYNSGLDQTMENHMGESSPAYMYVFQFIGQHSLGDVFGPKEFAGQYGVAHMEDVIYLFNTSFANWTYDTRSKSNRDQLLTETINKIWGNFADTRNPTKPFSNRFPQWQPVSIERQRNYVEISDTFTASKGYRQEEMDFWTLLVPDLQEVTNSSSETLPFKTPKDYESATWGLVGLTLILAMLCISLVAVVVVTRKRSQCRPVSSSHDLDEKVQRV